MNYGQPPRDTLHHPNGQQLAEDDTISATYPTGFYTGLVYEQSVQGQTPSPSSTNYPPDNSPPATEWDLGISILGIGENRRGFTLPYPTPPATRLYSHYPAVEAHDQDIVSSNLPEVRSNFAHTPRDGTGRSEGPSHLIPPERAGGYPYPHILGHRGRNLRPTFGGWESGCMSYGNWNESANSRGAPLLSNSRASSSGVSRHEYQPPLTNERSMPFNDPGLRYHPTMDHTTCEPENTFGGGPREKGWSGHHIPHREVHSSHRQQRLASTPTSTGLTGERTGGPEHAEPSTHWNLSNEVADDVGHLTETPPALHSDRPNGPPIGVQRPKRGRQAKRIADPGKAVLTQRPTRKGNPGDSKGSVAQLRATSVVTRGPTRRIMVPQRWYSCPTKQESWEEEAHIEFGGMKLTDAANRTYLDLDGHDDEVLNYRGVGSSISCRVNFSGGKFEKSKIRTTNNKTPPEAITKKKLSFEVAKFVKRHLESIKAIPGYDKVTFESLILVRLVRVSKASWQPVLLHETSSGLGSSS